MSGILIAAEETLLINEDDAIWLASNVLTKLTALVVADITGRSTDQS